MFKIQRLDSPVLISVQKEKSHRFANAKAINSNHAFNWATINGQRFNHICKPILLTMTEHHCAYCDLNDLGSGASFTIDHHRPKANHPRLSHMWVNLYPACGNCQESKNEQTNKQSFRPDESIYGFINFFTMDARTGKIIARPNLTDLNKIRVNETICFYGLNKFGRPAARKTELKKMSTILDGNNPHELTLNDFSYRFMW